MIQASFLRKKNGKIYVVQREGSGLRRRERWTPISRLDQEVLEQTLQIRASLQEEMIEYPCMNPDCKNTIYMTRRQVREFLVTMQKRYDMAVMPFCCNECRDKMLQEMMDFERQKQHT